MMKKARNFMRTAGAVLLATCLTACSGGNSAAETPTAPAADENGTVVAEEQTGDGHYYGGTLVVETKLEPSYYTINYTWDGSIPYINRNLYSKLVTYDDCTGELYGDLAESWDISEDLKTFTFKLREGVNWHDGTPFTSADVKWTIDSILDYGEGANAYADVSMIESVECPDDYTVVLHLSEPCGTMLNNLADYYGFDILPKHLWEGTDVDTNPCNTAPVGTGPFKFVEYEIGNHVTLEANKEYFGDGPYLDEVIFAFCADETTAMTAIEAGEAGFMTASPAFSEVERLRGIDGVEVDMQDTSIIQWMGFNMDGTREYISDPVVREAISYAIDNDEISEKLYCGQAKAATSYYTTLVEWADNTEVRQPKYDPDYANELLDSAGYERGADGYRFELTYRCFPTSIFGTTDIPTFVTKHLDAIGIKVNVEQYEWALRTEMLDNQRNWDLCAGGGDRGPDASNFSSYLLSTSGSNKMRYVNEKIDELFAEGIRHADQEERKETYFEIQRIISEDKPIYNFIEYAYPRVHSSEYINFSWLMEDAYSAQHMFNTVEWTGGTK